jgi:hypothetical protein
VQFKASFACQRASERVDEQRPIGFRLERAVHGSCQREQQRTVVGLDMRFELAPAREAELARDCALRVVQRPALFRFSLRLQRRDSAQRTGIAGARGVQQRTRLLALVLETQLQRRLRFSQSGWHGHGNPPFSLPAVRSPG